MEDSCLMETWEARRREKERLDVQGTKYTFNVQLCCLKCRETEAHLPEENNEKGVLKDHQLPRGIFAWGDTLEYASHQPLNSGIKHSIDTVKRQNKL